MNGCATRMAGCAALVLGVAVSVGADGFDHSYSDYAALLRQHVRPPRVDYGALEADRGLLDRVVAAFAAPTASAEPTWSRAERMAFWPEEIMRSPFVLLTLAAVALTGALVLTAQNDLEDALQVVLPRDAIPAISNPEFERAERAARHMADDELVLGLVGAREQRAYSTWQLDRHEIVNDTFEGRPVAVTW